MPTSEATATPTYVDELMDLHQSSELAQRTNLVGSFDREIVVVEGEAVWHYVLRVPTQGMPDRETVTVHGGALASIRSGGPDRDRTCDQSVMSRPLYH